MKAFYNMLTQITFDVTDQTPCETQASNVNIDRFINEHIIHEGQALAYYIAPTNDAYHHEESMKSIAKYICKRAVGEEVPHNPNYSLESGLPIIGVVGTMTTKLGLGADPTQEQSASHWLSWVLLPKHYEYLGQTYHHTQHHFILFDSLGTAQVPQGLKDYFTKGGEIVEDETSIKLSPFCAPSEIKFWSCRYTGQQRGINGTDCGWWAVYYALGTLYTGSTAFLKPIAKKQMTAGPLRQYMPALAGIAPVFANTLPIAASSTPITLSLPVSTSTTMMQSLPLDKSVTNRICYDGSGLKSTLHGDVYQLKLLMLFIKRGLDAKYKFLLATELNDAEKFDDVVFRCETISEGRDKPIISYRFLQAKHSNVTSREINLAALLNVSDGDFSLQKYFMSYLKVINKFKDGDRYRFYLCTNINIERSLINTYFDLIKEEDTFFNVTSKKHAARYRFKRDVLVKHSAIRDILKGSSPSFMLARNLLQWIHGNKKLTLQNQFFKIYHFSLCQEVIELEITTVGRKKSATGKFRALFLRDSSRLSERAKGFRQSLFQARLDPQKSEAVFWREMTQSRFDISVDFDKQGDNSSIALPDIDVSDQDINDFFNCLVFAVNQPNEVELGECIAQEVGEAFNLLDGDLIAHQFQKSMLDWMKAKQGIFLSEQEGINFFIEANQKISKLILMGPTLDYRASLLRYPIQFRTYIDITAILTSHQITLILVNQPNSLTCLNIYQALRDNEAYQKDDSYIFLQLDSALHLQQRLLAAFSAAMCDLLIIEDNHTARPNDLVQLLDALRQILQAQTHKRVVFITGNAHFFPDQFKAGMSHQVLSDAYYDYTSLTEDSQRWLGQRKLIWQGRPHTLSNLLQDISPAQVVDNVALLTLLTDSDVTLASVPTGLNAVDASCYIERQGYCRIQLNDTVFNDLSDDRFFITCSNAALPAVKKIRNCQHVTIYADDQGTTPSEAFANLCLSSTAQNKHWVHVDEEACHWQQTHGALTGLRDYINQKSTTVMDFEKQQLNNHFIIIAAEPGMGKSCLLAHLVDEAMQRTEQPWIIHITLMQYSALIESYAFDDIAQVVAFLAETQKLSHMGKQLLLAYLNQPDRLYLYLDGFDEISADHQKKVIQLLQLLKINTCISRVIISTRVHLKEDLENALVTFASALAPFTLQDKHDYLMRYWQNRLNLTDIDEHDQARFNAYIKKLFKMFSTSVQDKKLDFMGIPLQAYMLAEAFFDDFKAFYQSDIEKPTLPKTLSVFDLYQRFIDNKYHIYFNVKTNIEFSLSNNLKKMLKKSLTKLHWQLAFRLLLPDYVLTLFKDKVIDLSMIDDLKSIGIVYVVNDIINFTHRTFAEYFVADMLVSMLKKPTEHPKHRWARQFVLRELFKDKHLVIRRFLEESINQQNNPQLNESWQSICRSHLIPDSPSSNHKLKIDNTVDEDQTTGGALATDFKSLADAIVRNFWIPGQPDVSTHLNQFHENALKVKNRTELKNILMYFIGLVYSIYRRSSSRYSTDISNTILDLVKHYLTLLFNNENTSNELDEESRELLDEFCSLDHSYKNLKDFFLNKSYAVSEFLERLSMEKIFYLYFLNKKFTEHGIKILIRAYDDNKNNIYFIGLFAKVVPSAIGIVKQFALCKFDANLIIALFRKYNHDAFSRHDFEFIYKDQSLLWLERDGISIVNALHYLTIAMAKTFNTILDEPNPNGFHRGYAHNIWRGLILPLLDTLSQQALPAINSLALVMMIARFAAFITSDNRLSLDRLQMDTVLRQIEIVLNRPMQSASQFELAIKAISLLFNTARLKWIDLGDTLLVLDPKSEYQYELSLQHKAAVLAAIVPKVQTLKQSQALSALGVFPNALTIPMTEKVFKQSRRLSL